MNSFRTVVEVLAWAATLAGAAGIALHFSPSSARLLVFAASGAPYLMGIALVGLVVFAATRQWTGALVAAVVVALAVWTQAPVHLGDADDSDGPTATVTVMQANLLFDGADPGALVDRIREHDIDLLTVEELTPAAVADLGEAGLDQLLPHRYLSPGRTATGTGIWSRHPLTDTVEYDGFVLNQLSASVAVPGAGAITVYALHPVPPVYSATVWADELTRLHAIIEQAPTDRPVIVGGDFNATHSHSQFRALLPGRFRDAAARVGAGHLRTYPTDKRYPPLLGLDHILLAGAHALTVEAVDVPGADHRALIARIRLPLPR